MPLFTATADFFQMSDTGQAQKAIVRFQTNVMSRAVGVFLKACLRKIPYRTGFLRGSFRALRERFLKSQSADLNPALAMLFSDQQVIDEDFGTPKEFIAKKAVAEVEAKIEKGLSAKHKGLWKEHVRLSKKKDRELFNKQKKNKKIPKNQRYKEFYYTGPKTRIVKTPSSGVPFATPPDQVLFQNGDRTMVKIGVNISYFQVNDNFSKIRGSPWRAMEAGFQAMLNYIEVILRKYPLIDELLIVQRIKLEGDKVTKKQVADYRRRFTPSEPGFGVRR